MATIYKSKYTGEEIDALLDKVKNLSDIKANVDEEPTAELNNIKIGDVVYNLRSTPITKRTITYEYVKEYNNNGVVDWTSPIVHAIVEYNIGEQIVAEDLPQISGYNATNWEILPEVMPDRDITVSCMLLLNYYNATFLVDGSIYSVYNGKYTMPIEYPSAPSKQGFTFAGWTPTGVVNMPLYGTQFNATFNEVPIEYVNVTFRQRSQYYTPNTGSVAQYEEYKIVESVTYEKGTVISNSSEFYNKYSNITGRYKSIENNIMYPYTLNSDITIDMTYLCSSYTVTFKIDGNTVETREFPYTFPVYPNFYPTPESREGYTFNGWSPNITSMPPQNTIVTGSYTANRNIITLKVRTENYNTGSSVLSTYETQSTKSLAYGYVIEDVNALRSLFNESSFGYYLDIDTTLTYPYTVTGNFTVYGTYRCNYYTIEFDTSTGDLIDDSSYPYTYPLSMITYPDPIDLSEYNYYFVRWDTPTETYVNNNMTITAIYQYRESNVITAGYYRAGTPAYNIDDDIYQDISFATDKLITGYNNYNYMVFVSDGVIMYNNKAAWNGTEWLTSAGAPANIIHVLNTTNVSAEFKRVFDSVFTKE